MASTAYGIYRHRSRSGRCHSFDLYTFGGGRPERQAVGQTGLKTSRAHKGAFAVSAETRDMAALHACLQLGLTFGGWL